MIGFLSNSFVCPRSSSGHRLAQQRSPRARAAPQLQPGWGMNRWRGDCHPDLAFTRTSKGNGRGCSFPTEVAPIQNAYSKLPPPPLPRARQMRAFPCKLLGSHHLSLLLSTRAAVMHYTSWLYPHTGGYSQQRGFKLSVWSSGWRILDVFSEPTWG